MYYEYNDHLDKVRLVLLSLFSKSGSSSIKD